MSLSSILLRRLFCFQTYLHFTKVRVRQKMTYCPKCSPTSRAFARYWLGPILAHIHMPQLTFPPQSTHLHRHLTQLDRCAIDHTMTTKHPEIPRLGAHTDSAHEVTPPAHQTDDAPGPATGDVGCGNRDEDDYTAPNEVDDAQQLD
jgi:hypothetical protein